MENYTFTLGVIRPHSVAALEGHTVVVLERTPQGFEVLSYVLAPGSLPPSGSWLVELFRRRKRRLIAFAVTDNPELRAAGLIDITTDDQVHLFTVDVAISFRVSNPRLLVARRLDDPVLRMQREVERVIRYELGRRTWAVILHDFRDTVDDVLSTALLPLRSFAANYGLEIGAIWLARSLAEDESSVLRQRTLSEMQVEAQRHVLDQARELWELRDAVKNLARLDAMYDAAVSAGIVAIAYGGEVRTPQELVRIFLGLRQQLVDVETGGEHALVALVNDSSRLLASPSEIDVVFRSVWQSTITAGVPSELRTYAYSGADGARSVADDIREMAAQQDLSGTATARRVEAGARIRIVPTIDGVTFEPPSVTLPALISWARATFRMHLSEGVASALGLSGTIQFFVGPLLVGELHIGLTAIPVTTPTPRSSEREPLSDATTSPYRKIFVSYSHEDKAVVNHLERAYKALGDSYLRDVSVLRSGESWRDVLLSHIDAADIFQLCWSHAAKSSRNVEKEWRHALQLQRQNFMHPIYWQRPLPSPPPELAGLHFAFYQVPRNRRRARRAVSRKSP